MNEDIRKIVVNEIHVFFLKKNTIKNKFVFQKINVLYENHEKNFIIIKYSSFNYYRLTSVFSFHS